MQNKFSDLTNHLYAQLERLGDEELKGKELELECQRAEAMSKVASGIICAANTSLSAIRMVKSGLMEQKDAPLILTQQN